MIVNVIGIDPGIVDTGVVRLSFFDTLKRVSVSHAVFHGFAVDKTPFLIRDWVRDETKGASEKPRVFIEKYVPRPGMAPNQRMLEIERALVGAFPSSERLPNMGIKNVVSQNLMQVLGVWKFSTTTHHQDLRSAARIALFGMAKYEGLNKILSDVVLDSIGPSPEWQVDVLKGVTL